MEGNGWLAPGRRTGLGMTEAEAVRAWLADAYTRCVAANPLPDGLKAAALEALWAEEGDLDAVLRWLGAGGAPRTTAVAPHEAVLVRLAPSWSLPVAEERRRAFRQACGADIGAWAALLAYGNAVRTAYAVCGARSEEAVA